MRLQDRISKENYIKYFSLLGNLEDQASQIYKITNGNLDFGNYISQFSSLNMILEKCIFTEVELDLIFWYLYEDVEKKLYDSITHNVIIEFKSLEDVYDYLNNEDNK